MGLTPESVRKQVETSLANLQLNKVKKHSTFSFFSLSYFFGKVHILYLHAPDHKTPIGLLPSNFALLLPF